MPHFIVPATTPDAVIPAAVSPDATTAVVTDSAASGGSGHSWLWLLLALVILVVVGIAVFRFLYVRSRRRTWYGLAMNAYDRGTALIDGLKSGQSRSEFTMYANDYDGVLRRLQERAPSGDARWTVARVSAALEAVRQAGRHPGSDIVRTSVADLETTLRGLRDSALGRAADAQ